MIINYIFYSSEMRVIERGQLWSSRGNTTQISFAKRCKEIWEEGGSCLTFAAEAPQKKEF